jgi:hypothetical protein
MIYSIASSAVASSVGGTLRPSAQHRALSKLFENVAHNIEQFRL